MTHLHLSILGTLIMVTTLTRFVTTSLAPLYEDTGMHCKGDGVTDLMQWDHAQCVQYCEMREDCFGYVYNIKDNFTCILKGGSCNSMASDTWRFYKKPNTESPHPISNGLASNWNSDPAEPVPSPYELQESGETVHGPVGNVGNSFTKRDFHCAGKNMGNGESWSLGQCASACLSNDRCIGFIRLITGNQQCILKEAGCTKKPPTVWVFYEKTTNGEVWPEDDNSMDGSPQLPPIVDPYLAPVAADAVNGFGVNPSVDDSFMDTHQHCKGGVISNEMRTHEQCSRACLDAPDCVGYSIALRDPYQCYLKSKECEMVGQHSTWTFIKKNEHQPSGVSDFTSHPVQSQFVNTFEAMSPSLSSEDLFREMRAVRCIKFAEEYGATTAEQCKQMCLDRETVCVGVSFRSGSCKLITSFDCGGWQIYKKLADDMTSGGIQPANSHPNFEPVMPPQMDFGSHDHHIPFGEMSLNDPMVPPTQQDDILLYFHKLGGNCRGGRYLEDVWGSEAECALKCHQDERCRGFSYIKGEQRCTLKADSCSTPNVVNPNVSFWMHLQRQ